MGLKEIRDDLKQYLRETSVHGFRYLVESRNNIERFIWWLLICISFTFALVNVSQSFIASHNKPIITSLDLGNINRAPFPAITVARTADLDPWGFVEKSLDILAFECCDKPCEKSLSLRKYFKPLIKRVVWMVRRSLGQRKGLWTLEETKAFQYDSSIPALKAMRDEVPKLAAKIGALIMTNESAARNLIYEMDDMTTDNFAMYQPWSMNKFFLQKIKPIIFKATKDVPPTDLKKCQDEVSECHKSLKSGYFNIYLPFALNKIPYNILGFGHFLSYFSRFVSKNKKGAFLSNKDMYSAEQLIKDYLTEVWTNMNPGKNNSINLTLYELPLLLQLPSNTESTNYVYAPRVMHDTSCLSMRSTYANVWKTWARDGRGFKMKDGNTPCKDREESKQNNITNCCKIMWHLADKLTSILKVKS